MENVTKVDSVSKYTCTLISSGVHPRGKTNRLEKKASSRISLFKYLHRHTKHCEKQNITLPFWPGSLLSNDMCFLTSITQAVFRVAVKSKLSP